MVHPAIETIVFIAAGLTAAGIMWQKLVVPVSTLVVLIRRYGPVAERVVEAFAPPDGTAGLVENIAELTQKVNQAIDLANKAIEAGATHREAEQLQARRMETMDEYLHRFRHGLANDMSVLLGRVALIESHVGVESAGWSRPTAFDESPPGEEAQ